MNLTDIVALCGLIFGLSGAILGILNFFRDRARLIISLQWDMKILNDSKYSEDKYWGIISVTNVGRRSIYIQNAILKLPKKYDTHLILFDSTDNKKLGEGDPPLTYFIDQERLSDYSKDWKKIISEVRDSTGKIYSSKRVNKKPNWVNNN